VTLEKYQELRQRLETAKLSESADRTGTINFQVIEPPSVQLEPVSPKRTLFLLAVFLFAFGAALALAYGMNLLRPVFVSASRLAHVTGLTVLGGIGHMVSPEARSRKRREVILFAGAAAVLVLMFMTLVMFSTYDSGRLLEQLHS
jgi:hypothetical protein